MSLRSVRDLKVMKSRSGVKQSSFLSMNRVGLTLHLSCIINTLEGVKLTLQGLGESKHQHNVKRDSELI